MISFIKSDTYGLIFFREKEVQCNFVGKLATSGFFSGALRQVPSYSLNRVRLPSSAHGLLQPPWEEPFTFFRRHRRTYGRPWLRNGRHNLKTFSHVGLLGGFGAHEGRKVAERLNLFLDRLMFKVLVVAGPEITMAAAEGPMPIFKFILGHAVTTRHVLHFHLVVEGFRTSEETVPRRRLLHPLRTPVAALTRMTSRNSPFL